MRRKIVAGNWKMNKSLAQGIQLVDEIIKLSNNQTTDVLTIIAPSHIHLSAISEKLKSNSAFAVLSDSSACEARWSAVSRSFRSIPSRRQTITSPSATHMLHRGRARRGAPRRPPDRIVRASLALANNPTTPNRNSGNAGAPCILPLALASASNPNVTSDRIPCVCITSTPRRLAAIPSREARGPFRLQKRTSAPGRLGTGSSAGRAQRGTRACLP